MARDLVALGIVSLYGDAISLSVQIGLDEAGKPRKEVRLFRAGLNPTENGDYWFGPEQAASVMTHHQKHGVPVMIDLEHLSLDDESPNYDPDARGYGRLEVRSGELWLVGIDWTPDGADRIAQRRQTYLSPVFPRNAENLITRIHNIALTAQPATDHAMSVAASARTRGHGSMNAKQIRELYNLLKAGMSHDDAMVKLAIDAKMLQGAVKALGGDPSGDIPSLIAVLVTAVDELTKPKPADAPAADKPADDAPPAEPPSADGLSTDASELESLRRADAKRRDDERKELETLRKQASERNKEDRVKCARQLVGGLKFTPADVWADEQATTPQDWILAMPLAQLRSLAARSTTGHPGAAPRPAAGGSAVVPVGGPCDVSEYEMTRLRVKCDATKVDFAKAKDLYFAHKAQQVEGASTPEHARRFGRPLEQHDALANAMGRFGRAELVALSTPVRPIQDFSGASQRALEEFRLELLGALASQPEAWSEGLGLMLPGGSLRDTFPLDFEAIAYRERSAQGAEASTPIAAEIGVDKREFRAAKQAQLRRIQQGDFAYVRTWQNGAAQMAIARIHLRNRLVVALIEAGASTVWGVSTQYPSGIDGAYFFSATHKVNPFDDRFEYQGSTTWSNYQASGTPLGAVNLTAEKESMLLVPAPNGEWIGGRASAMLTPTSLDETGRLLLSVQDLIMDGTGTAGIRNEHYQSGFNQIHGAELTGSGTTADYYLLSAERIARGLYPWVIAEDSAEEILTWDESSDFYKDSGSVKVESKIYVNAALGYPHAIRLVKGA